MKKTEQIQYALLIIDMQNDFVLTEKTAVKGAKATIPAIKRAMRICHAKQIPVFHIVRAYEENGSNAEIFRRELFEKGQGFCIAGTKGAEIAEELTPSKEDFVLVKPRFSAFFGTNLKELLREKHINHVLVAGTQYPNCIRATAVDALCHDFYVTVLTDCCSAQTGEIAEANCRDLQNMGINCVDFTALENLF